MTMTLRVLEQREFDAARLLVEHPPQVRHPRKVTAFEMCFADGSNPRGQALYSCWRATELPRELGSYSCELDGGTAMETDSTS